MIYNIDKEVSMKYTKAQRLDIGKKIYTREITVAQASEIYEVNIYTARDYMRLFRDINDLPPLDSDSEISNSTLKSKHSTLDELGRMSKQSLIAEVIKARIEAERAKKGYEVKGGGLTKEFITSNKKNSK